MKQKCPWKLVVSLQNQGENKGRELVITELINQHNHGGIGDHHVKRRKLNEAQRMIAENALKVKANKKALQQQLKQETGKNIILKDLTNIEQKMKTKSPETLNGLNTYRPPKNK